MNFVNVISEIVGIAPNNPVIEIVASLTYLVIVVCIVSCFFGALFSIFK